MHKTALINAGNGLVADFEMVYFRISEIVSPMNQPRQFKPNPGQYLTAFERKKLLKSLQTDLAIAYRTRIEIMLLADDGFTQQQICTELGCSQATARYWTDKAKSEAALRWQENPRGRPKKVTEAYLNQLRELVSHSPRDYGYPFKYWTAQWLKKHLKRETGIEVKDRHINRLLKEMGLSTRSQQRSEQSTETEIDTQHNLHLRIFIRDLKELESH